jgi:hypothetical protein
MDILGQNQGVLEGPEGPSQASAEVPSPASQALVVPGGWTIEGLPGPVLDAGPSAQKRLLEFFTTEISNPNTRLAYARAANMVATRDILRL